MENRRALSTRRDMFLDERGAGLRVTWHPERDLVVLSVWQDDRCVGTFRMAVQDVPRLSGLLAAAVGEWVDQGGVGHGLRPAPGAAGDDTWPPPGTAGGGPRPPGAAGGGPWPVSGTAGVSLSVQRRLRLSRPVLRLRGLQHRRRRPA